MESYASRQTQTYILYLYAIIGVNLWIKEVMEIRNGVIHPWNVWKKGEEIQRREVRCVPRIIWGLMVGQSEHRTVFGLDGYFTMPGPGAESSQHESHPPLDDPSLLVAQANSFCSGCWDKWLGWALYPACSIWLKLLKLELIKDLGSMWVIFCHFDGSVCISATLT